MRNSFPTGGVGGGRQLPSAANCSPLRFPPLQGPAADNVLSKLIGLKEQIAAVEQNTKLFLQGREANHVLLTGPHGCGKSSVIRGIFAKYARRGLRLVEADMNGLETLPILLTALSTRSEKFILYCDDLSFSAAPPPLFSRLKSAMEGALLSAQNNLLFYATSNRRNIIAERFADNLPQTDESADIQPQETISEKTALASRFGLWVPFFAPDAEEYDALAAHWLRQIGRTPTPALIQEARNFADQRGAKNGRVAKQFAVGIAGQSEQTKQPKQPKRKK